MNNSMIKISYHGIFCIAVIALMLILLATGMTSMLYAVFAIVLYAGTIFYVTRQQESQAEEPRLIVSEAQQLRQMRILFGAHIAFIFLIIGAFLSLEFGSQLIYFIVAIIFALLIPFIIVTK